MLRKTWLLFLPTLALTVLPGCESAFEGEYADPEGLEIVDDRWNETDARKTGEEVIASMLTQPWLEEFKKSHGGKKPIFIVDDIENRTDEHIDTKAIGESLRDELINSQKVRFVDAGARDKVLKEIKYQNESGMVSAATSKKAGNQLGADFFVLGAISSQVHTQKGYKTVTYQTVVQLTNLETAEIVWSKKYDIKKRFKKSGSGW